MTLHWIEIGNPESEITIIFLHEGLGSIEMWKNYPIEICTQLAVKGIIYDRQGYGKSPGSLENRGVNYLHESADELQKLITFLDLKNIILYGHSDGGSIALIHASQYPTQIIGIICEAAHVFNETKTIQGVKNVRPLFSKGKMDGLKKYHGDNYKNVFYAWNNIWINEKFKNWSIVNLLAEVRCPQLIIQGKDDEYGTIQQVEIICEKTKGKSLILTPDNCGHTPFKEKKELVKQKVIDFIHDII